MAVTTAIPLPIGKVAMFRCGTVHNLEAPKELHQYLTEYGGKNLFGEPIFRLVWSNNTVKESRLPWPDLGQGVIVERPHRLKYGKAMVSDRFIVERWQPPEMYGDPEDWIETQWRPGVGTVDYGPYPVRGRYNFIDAVTGLDADGSPCFAMPTRIYLKTIVDGSNHMKSMSAWEYRNIIDAQDEAEEQARFDRRLSMIQDANRPSNYHDIWMSMNTPGK